jgi:hypothetical protein
MPPKWTELSKVVDVVLETGSMSARAMSARAALTIHGHIRPWQWKLQPSAYQTEGDITITFVFMK